MTASVYTHMLGITSSQVFLCVSASYWALSFCLTPAWTDWLSNTAKKEDRLCYSQSTDTVLDPEKQAEFCLSGLLISPGDKVCTTSICGNKCYVAHLSDITAFSLTVSVPFACLCELIALQGGTIRTKSCWESHGRSWSRYKINMPHSMISGHCWIKHTFLTPCMHQ